ncbi:MAG: 3-oxoacyl-ACP reductase FabG [Gammaproteobacteria bacterium]|nr:3-oxoacyl-ACP reductase [Paracoccaceae bacterium]MDG2106138.1 3-oxoacyl-ACP reductase FabG [Gammaproteobacteria bacterium]|tara:strand:+ start:222 stop:959 length:738 start_codon:yes stop_codon:yes gene_type:complete
MTEAKIALITGANRGIGFEILKSLSASGYTVVGTSRSQEGVNVVNKILSESDSKGFGSILDVKNKDSIKELNAQIKESHGPISILINNAGITADNLMIRMSDDEWSDVIETNLSSIFRITKEIIKDMMKQRYGRVINIGSVVGLSGNAGQVNYSSAKSAILGFSKSLAREVASRNITVNTISPGFIDTDMTKKLKEEQKAALVSSIPLGRMGSASELANVVKFIASEEASYITGENINVNGGLYM